MISNRLQDSPGSIVGRHNDYSRRRCERLNFAQNVQATDARQSQIEDDQIETAILNLSQGRYAISRLGNLESGGIEHCRQCMTKRPVIIDNQNLFLRKLRRAHDVCGSSYAPLE